MSGLEERAVLMMIDAAETTLYAVVMLFVILAVFTGLTVALLHLWERRSAWRQS